MQIAGQGIRQAPDATVARNLAAKTSESHSPDAGDTNIYLFLADSKAGSTPAALAAAHSPDTIQVWKD